MSDTEITPDEQAEPVEPEDNTELVLRSWGLSGEPVTWASLEMQPVIAAIRAVNTGFADPSTVQDMLAATYPDKGYEAANVCLAHVPSAGFTATVTDSSVRVDLAGDADLLLPDENCRWDWGDGTSTNDAGGFDHEYAGDGVYTVQCTVPVAGVSYSTAQDVTIGTPVAAEAVLDPGVAGRAPTVFESETDDLPNDNALDPEPDGGQSGSPPDPEPTEPAADEPVEEDADDAVYDPGLHTVEEVLAYVADHPDEANAIAVAEEAGKGRVTILDKL